MMSTTKQEIALMKKDIESLSEEVKEINSKIDNLTIKLLDPDDGVVSRVNKNTSFRNLMIEKCLNTILLLTSSELFKDGSLQ